MKDPKRLSLRDNHICSYNSTNCKLRINKQLINFLWNNVNHSGSIYNLMQRYKVCIFKKFWKALYISILLTYFRKIELRNKQLIKLFHNNVKNLSSILNCCNVKSVSSKKDANALSLRDIHIDSFFTNTRKSFLRINMQLINLD